MHDPSRHFQKKFSADQVMLQNLASDGADSSSDPKCNARTTEQRDIWVNDVRISESEVRAEAQHHPAHSESPALEAGAQALVVKQLLLQEAESIGLKAEPVRDQDGNLETVEEAIVRTLIESQVDVPIANQQECRQYYRTHPDKFETEPLYEARHILFSVSPSDTEKRNTTREKALELSAYIQKNPASFSDLARTYSDCPSREVNGNLGQLGKGSTASEFEAALQEMQPGTISAQPVETRFGFHIIALDNKVKGKILPFDMVQETIAAWLGAVSWSRAVSQYVRILAGNARIKGVVLEVSDGLLVQ